MNPLFLDIALAFSAAAAGGVLARLLKQPPLAGYLVAGLVLGPLGFHAIKNQEAFKALEEVGMALLLFLIGLELDWRKAKEQAKATLAVGLMQILGGFAAGYYVTILLTGDYSAALAAGAIVAFSSTVLVVKILSESHDLSSLHGRLTIGMLLLQDAVAMAVLAFAAGFVSLGSPDLASGSLVALKVASYALAVALAARYLLPLAFSRIARSTELLFTCSLAWCFLVAVFGSAFGIPLPIGTFLAGISIAGLPYGLEVVNRLRSLRDVFVILMFLNLGISATLPSGTYLAVAAALLAVTALGKPLIAFILLTGRGYKHRTAFLTAAGLGQLSEFSLLLSSILLAAGIIPSELAGAIAGVAVISLLTSTALLEHRQWWYLRIRGLLHRIQPAKAERDPGKTLKDHIVIFGYHRMGYHILKRLRADRRHDVVVVDFNPDIIKRLNEQGINAVYGDAMDEDIIHYLQIERASMVISTVPHKEETLYLIDKIRAVRDDLVLIVTSHQIDDALEYYKRGASYVILPHLLGGERIAELITTYEKNDLNQLIAQQAEEVKLIKAKSNALYYE